MPRVIAPFLLLFVLAACVSRHAAEGHHNSPAYAAGYTDGCATANARSNSSTGGGEQRDEDLMKTNRDYRAGWRAGYASCTPANMSNPLGDPFSKQ